MINDDQWWSMMINDDQWRICAISMIKHADLDLASIPQTG